MKELEFLLEGAIGGMTLQAGFSSEVETLTWWGIKFGQAFENVQNFQPIPAGPLLFQTAGNLPLVEETLQIVEGDNPGVIANWVAFGTPGLTLKEFIIPVDKDFRQFIPVGGPFIGLKIAGSSNLKVSAAGQIGWAPSSVRRNPQPIIVLPF